MSDANVTDLTDGGNTSLHYHSTDRSRSNHTGTQAASTISDFDTEVSNNSSVTANTAKNSYPSADATKVGYISVTQSVNLDTMESHIATNTAKNSYPSADATKVGYISVTQSVDLDTMESNIATNTAKNSYPSADATKVSYLTVTQSVNLDTMESNIATNNSKVSNATHTGEVTGSTSLVIANNVIDEANMKISNAPTNNYGLIADSSATGGWK
jgi:hypothetical protein